MKPDSYDLDPGREIRALTIWQPWATLLTRKQKRWETRDWSPPEDAIGSEVAIHSAKRWTDNQMSKCHNEPQIRRALIACERLPDNNTERDQKLPTGRVLAIAKLTEIREAEELVEAAGQVSGPIVATGLGDFSGNQYAWRLEIQYVYGVPIPAKGQQRLWRWEVQSDPGR